MRDLENLLKTSPNNQNKTKLCHSPKGTTKFSQLIFYHHSIPLQVTLPVTCSGFLVVQMPSLLLSEAFRFAVLPTQPLLQRILIALPIPQVTSSIHLNQKLTTLSPTVDSSTPLFHFFFMGCKIPDHLLASLLSICLLPLVLKYHEEVH